ncbi:hypothetical protein PUR21_03765 [Methylorubrum rhodesianum]|uniref:Uncharacterized protein n=1 Tax=Methylorubrum rhodesianum TaxID=29427 RepID=A0ABU9Z627_9HYPH
MGAQALEGFRGGLDPLKLRLEGSADRALDIGVGRVRAGLVEPGQRIVAPLPADPRLAAGACLSGGRLVELSPANEARISRAAASSIAARRGSSEAPMKRS